MLPNGQLQSILVHMKWKIFTIRSYMNLAKEMKKLNDKKKFKQALDLFNKYEQKDRERITEVAINLALKASTNLQDFQTGLDISNRYLSRIKSNHFISASLIHFFMESGDVNRAELIFNTSTNKTVSMYNSMMKGYIKHNMLNETIKLFFKIPKPDEINFMLFFNACARIGTEEMLTLVKNALSTMPNDYRKDSMTVAAAFDAFIKCGDLSSAEELLFNMKRTAVSYGNLMRAYNEDDQPHKTLDLYKQMQIDNIQPDSFIYFFLLNAYARIGTKEMLSLVKKVLSNMPNAYYNYSHILVAALDAFIKCGDLSSAEQLFFNSKRHVISYATLMRAYNEDDQPHKTLDLYKQMQRDNIQPNSFIYVFLLNACAIIGTLSISESLFKEIQNSFVDNLYIKNALIDMWGKSGCVEKAKEVFQSIVEPDTVAYTAMINSYGLNGMGSEAIQLFNQMPTKLMLEETYVCVLNACSHSGLVSEAYSIFSNIHNKTIKIYTTMVDCLSRAFLFNEAQQIINDYESHHPPNLPMLMALLSAARNKKDRDLAEKIFNRIQQLFPQDKVHLASASILLCNVYASIGDMEKSTKMKNELIQSGLKKRVGLSWTETNGEVFAFRAHDRSHPRSSEILVEVKKIFKEHVEHGYRHDASSVTRAVNEDESIESILCGHSERLAIAWNFVANPHTKRIQITNNLRVCRDCHESTKLTAKIRQCEIIVRDANRIHHFYRDGRCSCNDYF